MNVKINEDALAVMFEDFGISISSNKNLEQHTLKFFCEKILSKSEIK